MLIGKILNGFEIRDVHYNPPLNGWVNALAITSIAAEKDGLRYVFVFDSGPKILVVILHSQIAANGASSTEEVYEAYVLKAFENITLNLSDEDLQVAKESGLQVPFIEKLAISPLTGE